MIKIVLEVNEKLAMSQCTGTVEGLEELLLMLGKLEEVKDGLMKTLRETREASGEYTTIEKRKNKKENKDG